MARKTYQAKRVAVVGGGVIGLTSALLLAQRHQVTIIAEKVGSMSDSWKATAVWHVYLVPETDVVLAWAESTLEKLYTLARIEPESGVELVQGVELFRTGQACVPTWSQIPHLFELLTDQEIGGFNDVSRLGLPDEAVDILTKHPVRWGYRIEAPAACMHTYLSWLEAKARDAGIDIRNMRLGRIADVQADYDVIVNCSGYGARELVDDKDFVPYRGQYFVLRSSGESPRTYVGDDDHPGGMAYVIPRRGEVMVGGCAEKGVESLELTLDWNDVIARAGLYVPWLRSRTPDDQARPPVVGIRPCRTTGVRVEIDQDIATIPVVHNYGHGGSGFSLSWGCAESVSDMVASL